MDDKQRLCERIYDELRDYKKRSLMGSKEEIYNNSYKTEVIVNLYEILIECADKLDEGYIKQLLNLKEGILETLYLDYVTDSSEDVFYSDLKEHIEAQMQQAS